MARSQGNSSWTEDDSGETAKPGEAKRLGRSLHLVDRQGRAPEGK